MTEFILSAALALAVLLATAGLLRSDWEQARCAHLTFETAHARLVGAAGWRDPRVRITEDAATVQGHGACGRAREQIRFERLESLQ